MRWCLSSRWFVGWEITKAFFHVPHEHWKDTLVLLDHVRWVLLTLVIEYMCYNTNKMKGSEWSEPYPTRISWFRIDVLFVSFLWIWNLPDKVGQSWVLTRTDVFAGDGEKKQRFFLRTRQENWNCRLNHFQFWFWEMSLLAVNSGACWELGCIFFPLVTWHTNRNLSTREYICKKLELLLQKYCQDCIDVEKHLILNT